MKWAPANSKFNGSLFAKSFLENSIPEWDEWKSISDSSIDAFHDFVRKIFEGTAQSANLSERQTEFKVIWPILEYLGWDAILKKQSLSQSGRRDVPDGLLFTDQNTKRIAIARSKECQRYELGVAIVESKRWQCPLGRSSPSTGERAAPAAQMIRYLNLIDKRKEGKPRWGILTNGAEWRLYYQGAQSQSEQFFGVNLKALISDGDPAKVRHNLRVFVLTFRKNAFIELPSGGTFHERAIGQSNLYKEQVASNISDAVFNKVFPRLTTEIAASAGRSATLAEVRDAGLILLYRLLFALCAEDRALLPILASKPDHYSLRKLRIRIGSILDAGGTFENTSFSNWRELSNLFRWWGKCDSELGVPRYNGGLFDINRAPLLNSIELSDAVVADVVGTLSHERQAKSRSYINYQDLSVRQLGSIYERLLEFDLVRTGDGVAFTRNAYARKTGGSYYTPDSLVRLLIEEALEPLTSRCMDKFIQAAANVNCVADCDSEEMKHLRQLDPAERILDLRICDPAIGSGHFLVDLVDWMSDRVLIAMAEAAAIAGDYVSPLNARIGEIRERIIENSKEENRNVDPSRLDDHHIVRRMVLKRCVYGVDKNPMAVELAKIVLWLHTITVGAPLSFMDHHIRYGDSLFGTWVTTAMDGISAQHTLPLHESRKKAVESVKTMRDIERLADTEVAEVRKSSELYGNVFNATEPLESLLSQFRAFQWMGLRRRDVKRAYNAWLDGVFGSPVEVARDPDAAKFKCEELKSVFLEAARIAREEKFLHWEVAYPGVWTTSEGGERKGGFDAVIGNPPWDRVKLQEVEWFAARIPEIALADKGANRKLMIREIHENHHPLAEQYKAAKGRAESISALVRESGDFPLRSSGDVNLYSLFVERALALLKPEGVAGLLVPSGIASDKGSAAFFKTVTTEGRLRALYDFENLSSAPNGKFFPDVHDRFKFCAFVVGNSASGRTARCAFFLHDTKELSDSNRICKLTASDFARINPNTGTAPVFRTRSDAELTTKIYANSPILLNRSGATTVAAWPFKYLTMFHMTNDSGCFRSKHELVAQGAYPISTGILRDASGLDWVSLYEGKMVQAFDHRAASVVVNPNNIHRPGQQKALSLAQRQDPNWRPEPRYWVPRNRIDFGAHRFALGFKHVSSPTNTRSMIAALIPVSGAGNSLPLLLSESKDPDVAGDFSIMMVANLNSLPLDYVARQKLHGQNLNKFIVEQFPVIPADRYRNRMFGPKSAADIVRESVLELTYTSHDMMALAEFLGHSDANGNALPPYKWKCERRLKLRAKLDAVYFHLYGVTAVDDVEYAYSTFPALKTKENAKFGRFLSRDLCLAYINALAADDPDADIVL